MKNCPVCGVVGQPVPRETVLAMVKEQKPLDCKYWLCLTPSCPVAYYGRGGEIWRQTQIRVPIAQKDGARPKYVCYCSGVTEQDIIKTVISKKALTLTEAIAITGATESAIARSTIPQASVAALPLKRHLPGGGIEQANWD